jgi:hypothetical protein
LCATLVGGAVRSCDGSHRCPEFCTVRKCVFCGRPLRRQTSKHDGTKSKEHIFPQWLQKHSGLEEQQLFHARYTIEGELDNVRDLPFYSHVTGFVCRQCNTGWLNAEVENPAKPLLIPLIDGAYSGKLSSRDCHTIALWLFKTTLTLHSASQQERFIPAEHYATLYRYRAIPKDVVVTIAYHEGRDKDDLFWVQSGGWSLPSWTAPSDELKAYLKKAYRITARVGHLAWRVHYWPEENRPQLGPIEYDPGIVRQIHPVGGKGVAWPPARSTSDIREFDASIMIFPSPCM